MIYSVTSCLFELSFHNLLTSLSVLNFQSYIYAYYLEIPYFSGTVNGEGFKLNFIIKTPHLQKMQ